MLYSVHQDINLIFKKYDIIHKARRYARRFIPIESIAAEPSFYGYKVRKIESKAKQKEFIDCKKKIVALIAANRCGKTEAGVIKALDICLKHKGHGRFWILTESFDLQKSGVKEKLDMYLKPEDIAPNGIEYAKKGVYKAVQLKNGVIIEFKTFEQGFTKLQSAKLIGAWIDEEPPQDVFDEVYLRTVDLEGQVILTFTPRRGKTWTFKRLYQTKSEKYQLFNWGMADNPFIPLTEIEEMMREWSPKKVRMCLFGEYVSDEGAVFDAFKRDIHIKPLEYNNSLPTYCCVDWGVRHTDVGFYQHNKTTDEHYLIDHMRLEGKGYQVVMRSILAKPYVINDYFCDPAGSARSQSTKSGVSLLEMIKNDYGITFKYMTGVGIEESIEIVDSYFMNALGHARFFINSTIKNVPEYLEEYVRDEKTNIPIKDGINDHFCDQLRYYIVNIKQYARFAPAGYV